MAASVASYRAEGYRRFQLKVGGDPDVDIERIRAVRAKLQPGDVLVADANTGWLQHEAVRVVRAVARRRRLHRAALPHVTRNASPCAGAPTIRSCSTRTIDGLDMLLRAHADLAMDVVNLKISKLGGLTKTQQVRDLCVSSGIAMTLEDTWGGDITTAAIAHLAHSTPEALRFTATDFNSYVTVSTRRRRAEAQAGPDGRLDRAGPRRAPARQGAGPAARRGDGATEALSLSDRARSPLPGRQGGRATARPAPCPGGTTGAATDRRAGRSRRPPAASPGRPRAPRPSRAARLRRA